MTIQQDTREQLRKHDHVLEYFKKQGIKVRRWALWVGDYSLIKDHSTCVDTKKDVLELFMDLTKDHERFRAECVRAQEEGIRLIILVEEKLPPGGLAKWESPVWRSTTDRHKKGEKITKVNPAAMRKAMITMQEKYGVEFRFCDKTETGKEIVKFLKGEK